MKSISYINLTNGYETKNSQGDYHADVIPGHSIRIHGLMTNHIRGPQSFDKTFKVGDKVIYDRFNLIYTGTIVSIGQSTVTIKGDSKNYRLKLWDFANYNWNFDSAKVAAYNSEEMLCI